MYHSFTYNNATEWAREKQREWIFNEHKKKSFFFIFPFTNSKTRSFFNFRAYCTSVCVPVHMLCGSCVGICSAFIFFFEVQPLTAVTKIKSRFSSKFFISFGFDFRNFVLFFSHKRTQTWKIRLLIFVFFFRFLSNLSFPWVNLNKLA